MELTSKKKLYSIFFPKVLLDRKVVDVLMSHFGVQQQVER